jgi:hypothetical protein
MDFASASSTMNTHRPGPADTRLQRRWMAVAWAGWSILTLLSLTDFITSIHEYLVAIQTLCRPGTCVAGQPTPETPVRIDVRKRLDAGLRPAWPRRGADPS